MNKVVYDIKGLHCAHCAANLSEFLNKQQAHGIASANINFINKTLTVEYSGKPMKTKALLALALKGAHDPVDITEHEENKSLKVSIIDKEIIVNLIRIAISSIILMIGMLAFKPLSQEIYDTWWIVTLITVLLSYITISYDYLWKFILSFRHPTKMLNETVLMVVASLGALAIQEFPEACLVMILAQVGEIFEHVSVNKSKNSIIDTIDNRPKMATKIVDNEQSIVEAVTLDIGDIILIKTGETVPCDGKVIDGNGLLDTSSVTGEFKPVRLNKDDEVLSGTNLTDGNIYLRVEKKFNDSTTSKILDMVMESGEYKSKAEAFISKFATWYTPIMFLLALVIGVVVPLIVGGINGGYTWVMWKGYVITALTFLVISCPCAIVISVPLTYFIGTTLAFKNGIIIKGSNYLDRLNDLKVLVTDKTGTVTTGKFSIQNKEYEQQFKDVFEEYVCALESTSNHPIAKAILNEIGRDFDAKSVQNVHELPGFGISGEYQGKKLLFGNIALMNKENITISKQVDEATYLAVDGVYAGYILIDDTIKQGSKKAIAYLSKLGVETLMLTGGDEKSAERVSKECGITRYQAKLLPQDKIDYLKNEIAHRSKNQSIAYIGDGINDAPSIILSDIGIAMGGIGADAAVDSADIVLTNDDPVKIIEMLKIAKATRHRAIFNIAFALSIKLAVMILSLFGLIPMWGAVLSDTGLCVLLIIVSVLLLKKKIKIN